MSRPTFSRQTIRTGFGQVPNGMWTLPVSTGARVLLGWLHSHSDEYLATLTVNRCRRAFSTSSIVSWLEELETAGLIACHRPDGAGHPWSFELLADPWLALMNRADPGSPTEPIPAHHRADVGAPMSARVEEPTENTNGEHQPSSTSSSDDDWSDDVRTIANTLADSIAERGSKRPNVTATWYRDVDRMLRLDERDPARVIAMIRFLADGRSDVARFWQPNVRSPAKLREKYDQIAEQANRERGTSRPAARVDDDRDGPSGRVTV